MIPHADRKTVEIVMANADDNDKIHEVICAVVRLLNGSDYTIEACPEVFYVEGDRERMDKMESELEYLTQHDLPKIEVTVEA